MRAGTIGVRGGAGVLMGRCPSPRPCALARSAAQPGRDATCVGASPWFQAMIHPTRDGGLTEAVRPTPKASGHAAAPRAYEPVL